MSQKYKEYKKYYIGKNNDYIAFSKGNRAEGDYKIFPNGKQLVDLDLFRKLYNTDSIISKQCAINFVKHFYKSGFAIFNNTNRINININYIDDVVDYVNNTSLKDDLKLYLALIILRCDIDNNIYKNPNLNGCVRHFLQILMVFGYRFNIATWQMRIINNFVKLILTKNPQANIDYPLLISDIGYPNTNPRKINKELSASTQDFTDMYIIIRSQLSQL